MKSCCNGIQDIPCIHLLKITKGHPLHCLSDGKPVSRCQLIADGFLTPCPQIVKHETKQDQPKNEESADPDPFPIESSSCPFIFNQYSHRVRRHHRRKRRKPCREERKDKARIQLSFKLSAPVDDPLYCPKHIMLPPFRHSCQDQSFLSQKPPSLSLRYGPPTSSGTEDRFPEVLPVFPEPRSVRFSALRYYLHSGW